MVGAIKFSRTAIAALQIHYTKAVFKTCRNFNAIGIVQQILGVAFVVPVTVALVPLPLCGGGGGACGCLSYVIILVANIFDVGGKAHYFAGSVSFHTAFGNGTSVGAIQGLEVHRARQLAFDNH